MKYNGELSGASESEHPEQRMVIQRNLTFIHGKNQINRLWTPLQGWCLVQSFRRVTWLSLTFYFRPFCNMTSIRGCGELPTDGIPHYNSVVSTSNQGRLVVITVEAMHIAPVKSLGLMHPDTVHVDRRGIAEDRRLYLIDRYSRLVTQRTLGPSVQITSQYQSEREWLNLHFPDGLDLAGRLELGEVVLTRIWGRYVWGRVLQGQWSQALSDFCGEDVRLVRSDEPRQCYDEFPISLVS